MARPWREWLILVEQWLSVAQSLNSAVLRWGGAVFVVLSVALLSRRPWRQGWRQKSCDALASARGRDHRYYCRRLHPAPADKSWEETMARPWREWLILVEQWLSVALSPVSAVLRWGGAAIVVLSVALIVAQTIAPGVGPENPAAPWLLLVAGVIAIAVGFYVRLEPGAPAGLERRLRLITLPLRPPAKYICLKYLKIAGWWKTVAGILWTVRAEALVVMLFAGLILLPDQSAEAIRIMADPKDRAGPIIFRFFGWLAICFVLNVALISSGLIALRRAAASAGTEGFGESRGDAPAPAVEGDGAATEGTQPATAATAPRTGTKQACMILRLRRRQAYLVAALSALPLLVAAIALFTAAEAPGSSTELEMPLRTHLVALDFHLKFFGWAFLVVFVLSVWGSFVNLQKELGREADVGSERQQSRAVIEPWATLGGARFWASGLRYPSSFRHWGSSRNLW